MTKSTTAVNTAPTIAPLRNVTLLAELVERVQNRAPNLPGMATFSGPSGYGKSNAAMYAANRFRAYHVEVRSVWTRKNLCLAILHEMGLTQPANTVAGMVDQIGDQLARSQRPLLVDEADYLVKKSLIEVIRDIYEASQATVILIGEENLPSALKRWERVHGRMLDWIQAQPASLSDTRHLSKVYCPGIELADDLTAEAHAKARGSVRRVCVNLDRIREKASTLGKQRMTLADFPADAFFTGEPPAGRL
ncbi:MAG: ATP-binding protein [Parvibaculum sp.]|nr:ATP-binding protein [Parvibaculum sp.]